MLFMPDMVDGRRAEGRILAFRLHGHWSPEFHSLLVVMTSSGANPAATSKAPICLKTKTTCMKPDGLIQVVQLWKQACRE